jgi:triacylglycerol lipase
MPAFPGKIMTQTIQIETFSKLTGPINDWGLLRKSLLFAELSQIAYLHEEQTASAAHQIGFSMCQFFEVDGAQAYMFSNDIDLVIACRGTEPREWNDIKADINAWPVAAETIGRVHQGFKKEVDDLWPLLEEQLMDNRKELWLCGHSLGGAMATICASRCRVFYINTNPLELFTYGSPRVGTQKYVTYCYVKHTRWVNNNDVVTRVPPAWMGYRHVGQEMYLDADGNVSKLTKQQRIKDRYRGFILGIKQGKVDHFSDHAIRRYVQYIHKAFLDSEEEKP